jgi:hypothetical protein
MCSRPADSQGTARRLSGAPACVARRHAAGPRVAAGSFEALDESGTLICKLGFTQLGFFDLTVGDHCHGDDQRRDRSNGSNAKHGSAAHSLEFRQVLYKHAWALIDCLA